MEIYCRRYLRALPGAYTTNPAMARLQLNPREQDIIVWYYNYHEKKHAAFSHVIMYSQLDLTGVIDRLGTVQYDPLNPVGRNADLVFQARIPSYQVDDWQTAAYTDRIIYDAWDKQACRAKSPSMSPIKSSTVSGRIQNAYSGASLLAVLSVPFLIYSIVVSKSLNNTYHLIEVLNPCSTYQRTRLAPLWFHALYPPAPSGLE